MTLAKSKVAFFEEPHMYVLDGKELAGVTGLIHSVLGLGYGDDIPDRVKHFYIPRAAEYGHSVHSAIEQYDKLGIKVCIHAKSPEYQKDVSDGYWDVSSELESYIKNREGFSPIDNEYTVSDNERYASCIDNVWLKESTGGIWLVDTKTNNLDYYPGKADGLKEYLSWQLSVYAYMFEKQNPEIKVEGLAANWLRGADSEFWTIERKPDEDVKILLETPWVRIIDKVEYGSEQSSILKAKYYSTAKCDTSALLSSEAIESVANLLARYKQLEDEMNALKTMLREKMEQAGAKTLENDKFKATISASSTTKSFDTDSFKKDHPDLYESYIVEKSKKGSFTIKLK